MRFTTQRQALDYLRDRRAPSQVVKAFGDLIEDAEAMYATQAGGLFEGAAGGQLVTAPVQSSYRNNNSSFVAPFVVGSTSQQILPLNFLRTSLIIQNLSAASNMYFNMGSGASINNGILLTPGQGFLFDFDCPNDSVNIYFDSVSPQQGVALETRFTV